MWTDQPLLNAMEPVRICVRTAFKSGEDEIFLLLRGKVAVFLFDEEGNITEKTILNPKEGAYGAEIKAGIWHGLLVLESGSVIYEIKQGPFAPLAPENLAPWSPEAEDTEGVKKYLEWLESQI